MRLERRDPLGELRHNTGEDPQPDVIGAGEAWGELQPASHQRAQRAPRRIVVALQEPGRRHCRAGQREPLGAGGQQSGSARARVSHDHQARPAFARIAVDPGEQLGVGLPAADQRAVEIGLTRARVLPRTRADPG